MTQKRSKRILILAAGGHGSRFGRDKLLVSCEGQPLFSHCLCHLLPAVDQCIIVTGKEEKYRLILQKLVKGKKLSSRQMSKIEFTRGGCSRQKSVLNGLKRIPDPESLVAVQDAARPLTSGKLLRLCFESAEKHGSGVAAHRVTDTIHVADELGNIQSYLDRTRLWAAETPQVFRCQELLTAYQKCQKEGKSVTDEATAMFGAGYPVRLVESTASNPKVTHPADLKMLQVLRKRKN